MKGCLLIHGYTGAPFEVKPLARHLENLGYMTLCPTLYGHDGCRVRLRNSTYYDWLASAEDAFLSLREKCSDIAVLGFSMGGLLAFHLARKYNLKCMVTMGTPFYCFDIKNLSLDLLTQLHNRNFLRIMEYVNACFTPLRSNLHFKKLLNETKPLVKEIDIPILVVHGKKDPIAHYKSLYYIVDNVRSPVKEGKFYEDLSHRFQYCQHPELIYEDIGAFVKNYLH